MNGTKNFEVGGPLSFARPGEPAPRTFRWQL